MSKEIEQAFEEWWEDKIDKNELTETWKPGIKSIWTSGAKWFMPKWIPVSERWPESGEVILVWKPATGVQVELFNYGFFDDGVDKTTHWQPLPNPPEED